MRSAHAIVSALTLEYCALLIQLKSLANPSLSYRLAPGSMLYPSAVTRPFPFMWPS